MNLFYTCRVILCGLLYGLASLSPLQEGVAGSLSFAGHQMERQALFTESPEWIEQTAAQSVVELIIYDSENNRIARGSGFCAFSDRLLVTSYHVLDKMDHMTVSGEKEERYVLQREDIIGKDEDADVAICLLSEDSILIPLPCSTMYPQRGEKLAAIGSARGLINLVSLGNVCGHWSNGVVDWLIFSAPVSAGSSGGPIINDSGEVIGVIMGSYDDSQNLNFAVPIREAEVLAEELPEDYEKADG